MPPTRSEDAIAATGLQLARAFLELLRISAANVTAAGPKQPAEQVANPRLAWSPREVASSLGVSYAYVLGMIDSGRLKAIKAGGRYLVPDDELRAFLASANA